MKTGASFPYVDHGHSGAMSWVNNALREDGSIDGHAGVRINSFPKLTSTDPFYYEAVFKTDTTINNIYPFGTFGATHSDSENYTYTCSDDRNGTGGGGGFGFNTFYGTNMSLYGFTADSTFVTLAAADGKI